MGERLKHIEGKVVHVKGQKKSDEWVEHWQTYQSDSGIKGFWTTVKKIEPTEKSKSWWQGWSNENEN